MRLRAWMLGMLALLGLGYVVPYAVLGGVERWSGTFLFWLVFGVAVSAVIIARVARWDAPQSRRSDPAARDPKP